MKITDLTQENGNPCFYRGYGFRFEFEQQAEPDIEDVSSFILEDDAIEYVNGLALSIGFHGVVDRITLSFDDFEEDEEFELDELNYRSKDTFEPEEIHTTDVFQGKNIEGGIVIEWSYEKYVGYARNLHDIGIAGEWPFDNFKTEADLITGNEESTFRKNYSLLLTAQEVKESDDLMEDVLEALNSGTWKWNYFKNNPKTVDFSKLNIQ